MRETSLGGEGKVHNCGEVGNTVTFPTETYQCRWLGVAKSHDMTQNRTTFTMEGLGHRPSLGFWFQPTDVIL